MVAERQAFDTSRYSRDGVFNEVAFIEDLGALAQEAGDGKPLHKRINNFTLEEVQDGKVINRILGLGDVSEYYVEDTETDRREKRAGIKIRDYMLSEPAGTLTIWMSPPGGENNYKEGRLVIAVSTVESNLKLAKSYGIPTKFSRTQTIIQFNELSLRSTSVHTPTIDIEKIREDVLVFHPNGKSHFELLRQYIPLPKVWDEIESGMADKEKEAAVEDATIVWKQVGHLFTNARTQADYIYAGAMAELEMARLGRKISASTCGKLNSELLGSSQEIKWAHTEFGDIPGNNELSTSEEKWSYSPGKCRPKPEGCGEYKDEVGPCHLCKECEKKYNLAEAA